ncbi:DUF4247 domain-containing protein [Paenibacillus abyssi]|uniref:DUF4247 domain-containing protein n=1 Tax=Paenibacillus abyssi TaxID=1340531 RepID=A0A917FWI8_9BACL|nr:DUF4247 domain-containing protein [Paenibacillus abyssi]GGG09756.1 hypothetical protein GCM10010916_28310 [Paenibacillus abyssi]
MKKWWLQGIKYVLLISLIVPLLAACSISDTIEEQYPLESVNGSGSQTSYVYRAEGTSVPEAAQALIEQRKPEQQSAEDTERMFLVYQDELIHIQQDPEIPEDSLIEIDSKEYVRNNYNPGFLEGYLLASLIGDLFDHGRYGGGSYRGYTEKDVYRPQQGSYRMPTADDQKVAPPVTVERKGTLFKRSKDAVSTPAGSGQVSTSQPSSGKITRESSSGSSSVFKKPSFKKPKTKFGSGRIMRRR